MLLLGLALGFLIALPQLVSTARYYPRSIRSRISTDQKVLIGNVSLVRLLKGFVTPRIKDQVDGVFYPEVAVYIGLPGLVLMGLGWNWYLGSLWIISVLLAMGKHTPVFRATSWMHLRIPVRYCYFINLLSAWMACQGFTLLPERWQLPVLLLQAADLVLNLPVLCPMEPYIQRWQRPSEAYTTPVTQYLQQHLGSHRVSGLPYPIRSGWMHHFRTLGYNGGAQTKWMARFRHEQNPNGSGAHDWFQTQEDGPDVDWYGVKYAYTYRVLQGKWVETPIPHLYRNTAVAEHVPSWKEVEQQYGN